MEEWGIQAEVAVDAELLVTELVTNSVTHARSPVRLEVEIAEDVIEFSVSDRSTREVQLRIPGPDATTGRGILLLDRLASEWEVVPEAGGKTVRFRMATTIGSSVR